MKTGREIFAWNLRRLRVEREISQEDLATDSKVDRAYVSELETGEANPTLDLLDKLARVLKVQISDFFVEVPKGAKPQKPLPGGRPRTRR